MEAGYPPFEMKDPSGEFTGVSADLGRALAKDLGREVDIRNIPFDGLIAALKSGEIDCIISSMTATDERRQSIDFSDPYVKLGLALLVPAKSNVQNADDLKAPGRRIAVKLGTTGEAFARKHFPAATLLALSEDSACAMEVVKGGVDAWIYDQLSVIRYHEKNPESTRALLKPLSQEAWAIGFRKGTDALREQTNAFLKKFRADGGFDKIADKYLAEFREKLKSQGVPFVFDL
jgi:polar amino acid transport system substrate-binding protein